MAIHLEPRPVRGNLLKKLTGDEGLFALGGAVARVVELVDSDDQGTNSLAYYVLSDVALTQKVLRLANTPQYRTMAGATVTTISRAISLLGFDTVKTTALAMLLVDTLDNSTHAQSVRVELEASLCASLIGREAARSGPFAGAEEASIGALFRNIGPLLVASREHDRFREIEELIASGDYTPAQASQLILGSSFDTLSAAVLREWRIPEVIVRSLAPLPQGVLKPPRDKDEWTRQVVSFGHDAARPLLRKGGARADELLALRQRYGAALNLDNAQMDALFLTVRKGMASLLDSMQLAPDAAAAGPQPAPGLPDVLASATMDIGVAEGSGAWPSGKPFNARDRLLSGVQDVTLLRATGRTRVNELIHLVLETLYHSMGFRFATVCLKDAKSGQYRARIAFGDNHVRRQIGFCFEEHGDDLFHLAMSNDADLMISDAGAAKIQGLLPEWHRKMLPDARSFIVLPLVVQGRQLGLFYADRDVGAPEGVPPDEASLIRALKSQVLLALGNT